MANDIISYMEMCQREGASLQRGMNYRLNSTYSVILTSVRANAPYKDRIEENGTTIIYEGHDVPRTTDQPNPKGVDQAAMTSFGTLTQNGKFHEAASDYKAGTRPAELVRVYEKIKQGIWSYNGVFRLVDAWIDDVGNRHVYKFKLVAIEQDVDQAQSGAEFENLRRVIPTSVKIEVWNRDGGKCVRCGATDNLHFDHIIPFSKGGASTTAENIQILCGRHNISKRDRIE